MNNAHECQSCTDDKTLIAQTCKCNDENAIVEDQSGKCVTGKNIYQLWTAWNKYNNNFLLKNKQLKVMGMNFH